MNKNKIKCSIQSKRFNRTFQVQSTCNDDILFRYTVIVNTCLILSIVAILVIPRSTKDIESKYDY